MTKGFRARVAASAGIVLAGTTLSWLLNRNTSLKFYAPDFRKLFPAFFGHSITLCDKQKSVQRVAEKYELDPEVNMLPQDTCERLPSTFDPWERILDELPDLNERGTLRNRVEFLPLIEREDELNRLSLLRRAHVVLAMIVQSYVFGHVLVKHDNENEEDKQVQKIPVQIARPFMFVCDKLGIATIVCSCTLDTWNWKFKSNDKTFCLGNLTLVSRMTNEPAEVGFHIIPAMMNGIVGDLISHLFFVDEAIISRDNATIINMIQRMKNVFEKFLKIFQHASSLIEPSSFDRYRYFLQGFYPHGIIFEQARKCERSGIGDSGYEDIKVYLKGPSAGQSTMIFVFDKVLGIHHTGDAKAFQEEMVMYIPRGHRHLLQDLSRKLEKSGSLREYANTCNEDCPIKIEYNACLDAFTKFRKYHLAVASRYLAAVLKGTGGSDFRALLRCVIGNTEASRSAS